MAYNMTLSIGCHHDVCNTSISGPASRAYCGEIPLSICNCKLLAR